MTGKNIVGIIFSNAYDECISELTGIRTMGSVPFACRYRLIDFALSNMVNSGIEKVGVLTKAHYQSLMDHVGTGKPWDLSRKNDGLFILPPFSTNEAGGNRDKLASLKGIMGFISRSDEEYVLLSDCNVVCNLDVEALMDYHTAKNADITIVYKNGKVPALKDVIVLDMNADGKAEKVTLSPVTDENVNFSLNVILMKKALLERLINDAISLNHKDFETDLIQGNVNKLNIYGFEATGYSAVIESMESYFKTNMELLNMANCDDLFNAERPVYTKVRDDMPAIYGIGSSVKNSLIADGCIIEGTVENSILFRGVRVEKGAVVKDSIVMQDVFVAQNATLNCVVADKSVVITPNKTLSGAENYPVYIGKEIVI
jgi:glucose-1-phosphate adenylyltransferase